MNNGLSFRPPVALKGAALSLLVLLIVLEAAKIFSTAMELQLWKATELGVVSRERIVANNIRVIVLNAGYFGAYAVTAIVFLCTLFRLHKNAQALGARDMRFSAGWTIGWFFVPIANLFMPYKTIRDLWKASVPAAGNWRSHSYSGLLVIWWLLWVVSRFRTGIIADRALTVILGPTSTIDQAITTDYVAIVLIALDMFYARVAITLLLRLMRMQQEKFDRFGEDWGAVATCLSCGEAFSEEPAPELCPVCGAAVISDVLPVGGASASGRSVPPALG